MVDVEKDGQQTPKFSLRRKERKVQLENEDGSIGTYRIRELTGQQSEAYLDEFKDRVILSPEGKVVGMNSFAGIYDTLLSKCLYDDQNVLVKRETIQQYPASVQKGLFEIAQTVNGLNEKGEVEVKKA